MGNNILKKISEHNSTLNIYESDKVCNVNLHVHKIKYFKT